MTTPKTMNVEEESSFSTSSSSSSSSSNGDYHSPTSHFLSTSSSSSSTSHLPTTDVPPVQPQIVSHKRRAGRKKFRETRHPVYRGVRERNGGKWVCEVREPQKKTRIWLGTYQTPEMAARAHDVAAIALRGKSAPLNFPDSAWILPRATSNSGDDIRAAAARAAAMFRLPSRTHTTRKHEQPQQLNKTHAELPQKFTPQTPLLQQPSSIDVRALTGGFVDEEALFNMPGLLQNMAQGLLLTPPPMQPEFDWNDDDCHLDITLWNDN